MRKIVRAKFRVCEVEHEHHGRARRAVTLFPVSDGNPENDEIFEATPSGSIMLGTVTGAAVEHFTVGKEFYVDFTEADAG